MKYLILRIYQDDYKSFFSYLSIRLILSFKMKMDILKSRYHVDFLLFFLKLLVCFNLNLSLTLI